MAGIGLQRQQVQPTASVRVVLDQERRKEQRLYRLSWALLVLLLVITVCGPWLMPHGISPEDKIYLVDQEVNGVIKKVEPPFAPSGTYVLGTDQRGYDMLSLLLNGARYTIGLALAVTLLRFALALPIGLYVGATNRGRSLLSGLQMATASVPAFLLIFPGMYALSNVLQISTGLRADDPRLLAFTGVLFVLMVLVGIFPLAQQFADRAAFHSGKLYVTAARTMGASTSRVVFRHLMPHLRPELQFAFLSEFVAVLFLMGQLAVVGVFIGGGEPFQLEQSPTGPGIFIQLTTSGEWGGLISNGVRYVRQAPWMIFVPTLFLVGAILIVSFFSKQLQKRAASPAFYTPHPLRQNKPALVAIATVVIGCLLLVTLGENKSPVATLEARIADQEKQKQAERAAPSNGAPGAVAKPTDEMIQKALSSSGTMFMTYLAENRWEYAEGFIVGSRFGQNQQVKEPFNRWMQAFQAGWSFVGTGEARALEAKEPTYELEVIVKDVAGQEHVWTLTLQLNGASSSRIVTGKGGPQ